jgi:phage terminase small subunit
MPRKSAASMEVAPNVSGEPERLRPPAGLSRAARVVFTELVNAVDGKHFSRADMPLLIEYCTACAMARTAAKHLEADGPVVDGRVNQWLVVQEKQIRAMTALAMRLRLSPQSRIDARAAGRSSQRPGSFYDMGA